MLPLSLHHCDVTDLFLKKKHVTFCQVDSLLAKTWPSNGRPDHRWPPVGKRWWPNGTRKSKISQVRQPANTSKIYSYILLYRPGECCFIIHVSSAWDSDTRGKVESFVSHSETSLSSFFNEDERRSVRKVGTKKHNVKSLSPLVFVASTYCFSAPVTIATTFSSAFHHVSSDSSLQWKLTRWASGYSLLPVMTYV